MRHFVGSCCFERVKAPLVRVMIWDVRGVLDLSCEGVRRMVDDKLGVGVDMLMFGGDVAGCDSC